jgi:hypothetical protein
MTTRPDHPVTATKSALAEFSFTVDELSTTFAALKRQHSHEQAILDLTSMLLDKDKSWLTIHLAVAIATLNHHTTTSPG